MTRVLHVTRDYPPRINGGISTAVGGLVAHLEDSGVGCAILSFDGYRPRASAQAAHTPAIRSGDILRVAQPSQLAEAAAFVHAQAADIVHVHHAMLWPFAAEHAAGPTVFTAHVAQAHARKLRGLSEPTASERDQARAFAEASCVTVPSRGAQAVTHPSARVIPLGVDETLGGGSIDGTGLYVGRFGDIKGTRELVDAIGRANVEIAVAGGLPDNPKADARWRKRFAEVAPTAQLTGWLDPVPLAHAYRAASFVIVPSWFETFGQVVAEAMQYAVPAIATRAGGLPELDPGGEAGYYIDARDVDALAEAIATMTRDRCRRRRMAKAAAQMAPEWRWTRRIRPWLALYDELT